MNKYELIAKFAKYQNLFDIKSMNQINKKTLSLTAGMKGIPFSVVVETNNTEPAELYNKIEKAYLKGLEKRFNKTDFETVRKAFDNLPKPTKEETGKEEIIKEGIFAPVVNAILKSSSPSFVFYPVSNEVRKSSKPKSDMFYPAGKEIKKSYKTIFV